MIDQPRGLTTKDRGAELQKILDARMVQIAKALPPGTMTPDHFARVVLTLCGKNPRLMECNGASLIGAVMQSAQLGLSPDPVLGEAWFVPFKGVVTFIPGYKGLIKLAYQSEQVAKVSAHVVRDGDAFDFEYGLREKLSHRPANDPARPMTHVYATMKIKGGDTNFLVMSKQEVDDVRKRSPAVRAGKSTPWDTDYEAMAMKTALRRLCKLGPASVAPRLQQAVALDELAEHGLRQNLADPFLPVGEKAPDAEWTEDDEKALAEQARAAENNQAKE